MINGFMNSMRVYNVDQPKLRLGNPNDGGYVITDGMLAAANRLITCGVGNDDGFETAISNDRPIPIEMYDGTCYAPPLSHQTNVIFVPKNIGNEVGMVSLQTIISGKRDYLLKVDVEGAEYSIFEGVNVSDASGIIIEFHDVYIPDYKAKICNMITTTFKEFILCHIHGNSWGGTHEYNISPTGLGKLITPNFPNVLELTFISRRHANPARIELEATPFPIPSLDASNNSEVPDIDLPWVNAI